MTWDNFVNQKISEPFAQIFPKTNIHSCFFHKSLPISYRKFRDISSIIDLTLHDSESLQYKPLALVCSTLYLLIGVYCGQFVLDNIGQKFNSNFDYLASDEKGLNKCFSEFLRTKFKIGLDELAPTIKYVSTYFEIKIDYSLPFGFSDLDEKGRNLDNKKNIHSLQEVSSTQFHNPLSLNFVTNRKKAFAQ